MCDEPADCAAPYRCFHRLSARVLTTVLMVVCLMPVATLAAVSLEYRVATGTDDAEEQSSGRVRNSSSDLEMAYERTSQIVGLRFRSVAIPRGVSITRAWLQFQTDEVSTDSASLKIDGERTSNAAGFSTTKRSISSRARTSKRISWSPPPWRKTGERGSAQRTPDLAPVIQEIVNRSGWASGNALVLIVSGSGKRVAESYNGSSKGAPMLHVEYAGTPPSGGSTPTSQSEDVTVSWSPNPEPVRGYRVYYGPTASNVVVRVSDLTTSSGDVNPVSPSVTFDAESDLGAKPGDKVCFRVVAYNQAGDSPHSDAACRTLQSP